MNILCLILGRERHYYLHHSLKEDEGSQININPTFIKWNIEGPLFFLLKDVEILHLPQYCNTSLL